MLFPLRLALRHDTYGRDDFSPNGRHSAIVNPGLRWVKNRPDDPETPFPVYPEQRTSSDRLGMSQTCHFRTLATLAMAHSAVVVYSITSSARVSNDGGTCRPNAFAVLRLMTSSNLVGC
jgi:hypothetical protein